MSENAEPWWYDSDEASPETKTDDEKIWEAFERENPNRWAVGEIKDQRMQLAIDRLRLLYAEDVHSFRALLFWSNYPTEVPGPVSLAVIRKCGFVLPGTTMIKAAEKRVMLEHRSGQTILEFC